MKDLSYTSIFPNRKPISHQEALEERVKSKLQLINNKDKIVRDSYAKEQGTRTVLKSVVFVIGPNQNEIKLKH